MTEAELFASWRAYKSASSYFRLRTPTSAEHEFMRTGVPGDGYARVKFSCSPADALSLRFAATWPDTQSAGYVAQLERAIATAVVDEMFSHSIVPFRGCSLVLQEVGWDEVGGSEVAFRIATERALRQLRTDAAAWEQVYPPD